MTAAVGLVSWVDRSLPVVGGQDVSDSRKSCAGDKGVHVSRWISGWS